jgi:cyclopropane fatty-acyl-phospholipid synthase-like methyltransferase
MNKAYSEACDRNREPILSVLKEQFADCKAVLEIGSGTGQHAVYFAKHLPHLIWHTSDLLENHADIRLWLDEAGLENLRPPLLLDVMQAEWPELEIDAVFSANTVHIMHWQAVTALFAGVGRLLPREGAFALYGPFIYGHRYTSRSNADFDAWLKQRDPHSGIRNFEDLDELARASGLAFKRDYVMPANNRVLCWEKGRIK